MTAHEDRHRHRDDQQDEVGSVAEETAKLLGALHDWAGDAGVGAAAQGLVEGLRSADDHVGHGQDCRWCPICRLVNAARSTSPEVREHLAAAIGSLAQAASAALRDPRPPSEPGRSSRSQRSAGEPTQVPLDE